MGGGGIQTYTFKASGEGENTLQFVYKVRSEREREREREREFISNETPQRGVQGVARRVRVCKSAELK